MLQQNFLQLSAIQKYIPFKVHGSGKFLDSRSPHPIAHLFSGLANMSKMDMFGFKGQNTRGLMCTCGSDSESNVYVYVHVCVNVCECVYMKIFIYICMYMECNMCVYRYMNTSQSQLFAYYHHDSLPLSLPPSLLLAVFCLLSFNTRTHIHTPTHIHTRR